MPRFWIACLLAWLALGVTNASDAALHAGNTYYANGELEEAREAYTECLKQQPDRTDCTTNLASVLTDLGPQHEAFAETLYRRVLQLEEGHADAAFNLALMLQDRKTDEATREAAMLYQRVVVGDPQQWDAWCNLASALTELKVPVQAIRASQRAIVLLERAQEAGGGADDTDIVLGKLYYLMAMALTELSDEQCTEVATAPDSLLVGVDEQGGAAPTAAVCHENALNALRTSLLLSADLLTLRRDEVLPDGGRGAAAAAVSDGAVGAVELITAADVLVYFGELGSLLQAFASLTATGGDLVFSCERATPEEAPQGWRLRPSGRFAHTKPYVLQTAAEAGYTLLTYREITPRFENGAAVQGHLFALRRTDSGG